MTTITWYQTLWPFLFGPSPTDSFLISFSPFVSVLISSLSLFLFLCASIAGDFLLLDSLKHQTIRRLMMNRSLKIVIIVYEMERWGDLHRLWLWNIFKRFFILLFCLFFSLNSSKDDSDLLQPHSRNFCPFVYNVIIFVRCDVKNIPKKQFPFVLPSSDIYVRIIILIFFPLSRPVSASDSNWCFHSDEISFNWMQMTNDCVDCWLFSVPFLLLTNKT